MSAWEWAALSTNIEMDYPGGKGSRAQEAFTHNASFMNFHKPWWGMPGFVQAGAQQYQVEYDTIPSSCGPSGERVVLLGFEGAHWSPAFLVDAGEDQTLDLLLVQLGCSMAPDDLFPEFRLSSQQHHCLARAGPHGDRREEATEVASSPASWAHVSSLGLGGWYRRDRRFAFTFPLGDWSCQSLLLWKCAT